MRARGLVLALAGSLFALQFHASFYPALAQSADALVGQVSSAQEGAMEGVVVSAKKAGSIVTVSVVTDDKGRYQFPAARLEPGAYTLSDPRGRLRSRRQAAAPRSRPARRRPSTSSSSRPGISPTQLSNAEWLASFPGTDRQKKALLNCISCHDLDRIVRSHPRRRASSSQIFDRMVGYYPGSTPEHPQRLIGNARRTLGQGPGMRAIAEYLASVNLSKDETWAYPLKTLRAPDRPRHPRHHHRIRPAAQADPAARRRSSTSRAWSGSRISASSSSAASIRRPLQGLGISDAGAQAGLPGRHARSRGSTRPASSGSR